MDRGEELVPSDPTITYANGKSAREMRNAYPVYYVKAAYDIAKKFNGDDFFLMPRAGFPGSSQYAGFWGGDIAAPQEGLRCAILAAQKAAILGYPIWGSDIGGYWQGEMDREVTARWLAFGCFNPIMEFGPTENRAPWDMAKPPHYDTTLLATWRLYAVIHEKLADYSHALAKEAHDTGMPPIRPLFLEYGNQREAWQHWQTFTYGGDILVAAIWEKGTTIQNVYLPAGARWRDAWQPDRTYEGGQEITINTPFYKIPIFVKEGATIDLGDLNKVFEESMQKVAVRPNLEVLQKGILH